MAAVSTTLSATTGQRVEQPGGQPPEADSSIRGRGAEVGRRSWIIAQRLTTRLPSDRALGWILPIAIAVIGGILRFWRLSVPGTYVFDETYYAREAWRLLNYGVEYQVEQGTPEYVVHPPVGKWVIGIGEWVFGNDSFGWRFSVAVIGTISIVLIGRIARRLFGSTLLGAVASILLCVDGLAFVHSRTALLDPILAFFALCAFGCLLLDRDRSRAKLARLVAGRERARFGPGLGLRPYRLAAGVFLGLTCGCKWSGLWFVAAFGLLSFFWDAGARKASGVSRAYAAALLRDALPAFASLVLVAFAVYLAGWTGWFLSDAKHAYFRDWAAQNDAAWPIPGGQALASLWHYHVEAYNFHIHLHDPHPYRSNPWNWLILGRPVSYYYQSPHLGQSGCTVQDCSQAILALGNPVIWWGSILAIPVVAGLWLGRRDWRAGAVLAGLVAGYLPWFQWQARTIYYFYALAFLPYLVLSVTMVLGMVIGPRDASARRRTWGAAIAGTYVLLAIVTFWWFFPIYTAEVIPYHQWQLRMWLPSWV